MKGHEINSTISKQKRRVHISETFSPMFVLAVIAFNLQVTPYEQVRCGMLIKSLRLIRCRWEVMFPLDLSDCLISARPPLGYRRPRISRIFPSIYSTAPPHFKSTNRLKNVMLVRTLFMN